MCRCLVAAGGVGERVAVVERAHDAVGAALLHLGRVACRNGTHGSAKISATTSKNQSKNQSATNLQYANVVHDENGFNTLWQHLSSPLGHGCSGTPLAVLQVTPGAGVGGPLPSQWWVSLLYLKPHCRTHTHARAHARAQTSRLIATANETERLRAPRAVLHSLSTLRGASPSA
jgi:hypothetical protein